MNPEEDKIDEARRGLKKKREDQPKMMVRKVYKLLR